MSKLILTGTVGEDITIDLVKNFLAENKGNDVSFDIATMGGSLEHGIAIYNLIKSHQGRTKATLIGQTASAGTVIAMACDYVEAKSTSLFLIHNSWTRTEGNAYDLQKKASSLLKNDELMIDIYQTKTGLSRDVILDLMKKEDWLTVNEAAELGFINNVITSETKVFALSVSDKNILQKTVNDNLILKLESKMKNLFSKKEEQKPVFIHALKDGKNILANAEDIAEGVEVAPSGAMTLDDGEYTLQDGTVITVTGGVVTKMEEPAKEDSEEAAITAIVDGVSSAVDEKFAAFRAEIDAKLARISSSHVPKKNTVTSANEPARSIAAAVAEVTGKIREEIIQGRKK